MAEWGKWKLIIGDQEYPTPYEDEKAWEKAMEERGKQDTARKAVDNFQGGVYDKINEIIKEVA